MMKAWESLRSSIQRLHREQSLGAYLPDYKASPLRWPFLTALFLFICGLTAFLEYGLRTIPIAENRTAIPHEYFPVISVRSPPPTPSSELSESNPENTLGIDWHIAKQAAIRIPSERQSVSPSLGKSGVVGSVATVKTTQNPAIYKVRPRITQAVAVPPETEFPKVSASPTYFTLADQWIDDPAGQKLDDIHGKLSPVFPGEEKSGMCIYHFPAAWWSNDPRGCAAVWVNERSFHLLQKECDDALWVWLEAHSCIDPSRPYCNSSAPCSTVGDGTATLTTHQSESSVSASLNSDPKGIISSGAPEASNSTAPLLGVATIPSQTSSGAIGLLKSSLSDTTSSGRSATYPTDTTAYTSSPLSQDATLETFPTISGFPTIAQFSPVQVTLIEISTFIEATSRLPDMFKTVTETFTDDSGRSATRVYTSDLTGRVSIYSTGMTALLPVPVIWSRPSVTTVTNSQGQPLTTMTSYPAQVLRHSTTSTLLGPQGLPTATIITDAPASSTLRTLVGFNGTSTATITEYQLFPPELPSGAKPANLVLLGSKEYFIVFFVPVLLTAVLSIPIQMIDTELKLLLPFRCLTRPRRAGCTAQDSIYMSTGSFLGRINGLGLLWRFRDPISLVSDLLVVASTLLVAFSSEMIGLKLRGSCRKGDLHGCFLTLAAFKGPARAGEALLAFMLLLVVILSILLSRWRSGLATHPTSIATACSLLQARQTKDLIQSIRLDENQRYIRTHQMAKQLEGNTFVIRHHGAGDYGIDLAISRTSSGRVSPSDMDSTTELIAPTPWRKPEGRTSMYLWCQPISERILQSLLLSILCGLWTTIVYYESTELDTSFERFMDSQDFGVRFLFTSLGVIISFFWGHMYSNASIVGNYRRMSQSSQAARSSILTTQNTNLFAGLGEAVLRRDPFTSATALTAILSKFTPILLSNIPFEATQTWTTHLVCLWMTIIILALMILVLLWSMFMKWPYLPVDPSTLGGRMYYVCDSAMLKDIQGLSAIGEKERNRRIEGMRRTYRFGTIIGLSGERRIGVDYADESRKGIKLRTFRKSEVNFEGTSRATN